MGVLPVLIYTQAVVARTACLATLPEFVATARYKATIIDKEHPELYGRLNPLMGPTPMEVLGDLHNPPLGKSFSRLSKKLTHFHYTLCCNELWAKRDNLPATVRYAWMHNLPGGEPGQPQGFQGQGAWLRCLPKTPATTLPDCVFRWGFSNDWVAPRQALDAPARGQAVALNWTPMASMHHIAVGGRFAKDMTD